MTISGTAIRSLRLGAFLLGLCVVLGLAAACQSLPTGPSLSALEISNVSSQSTIGNSALCCCHVTGVATNRNSVPLDATIQFTGYDSRNSEISTILYFIPDLAPGAAHNIDAPGFLVPCSAITRYTWEVKVRGITYPPL